MNTNRKHRQMFSSYNKGLLHLLEMWFPKGKVAMEEYMKEQEIKE